MWLFTNTGFISAVFKDQKLVARARDRQSLESLASHISAEIIKTPLADYPYRVITDYLTFSEWVALQARLIDYPNFKSEIATTRGHDFAHALNQVWSVMHEVEDKGARKR